MKAIIFSHENGGSYVMDSDGFFDFVKGYTKKPIGTEIEIADIPTRSPITLMRVMSYAACFILVAALSIFAYLWNNIDYTVYVDINPSVEMQFNRINKLKTSLPINGDGTQLLDGLKLSGSAADAVPALILAANEKGYLNIADGGTAVVVTVVAMRGGSPEGYISDIMTALGNHDMLGYTSVESCREEYYDRAAALGVSPGKLKMAEALILASDEPISLEEALEMPVDTLFVALQEAEAGTITDAPAPIDSNDGDNPIGNAGDNNQANPGDNKDSNLVPGDQTSPGDDPEDDPLGSSETDTDPGTTGAVSPGVGPGATGSLPPGQDTTPTPTPTPGSDPGSDGQTNPGSDDSLWIADPVKPGSGGKTGNTEPDDGNGEPENPDKGSGGDKGKTDSKVPDKPTEGYVEPDCDKDGYWWFYDADEDKISYTYNPGTALGHVFDSDKNYWVEGRGWCGVCLRCGKTVLIS